MKGSLGTVQFRVTGLGLEKLLNAARKQGIVFRAVRRAADRSLLLQIAPGDYAALRNLAEEKGYQVGEKEAVGFLRLLGRLRRRWALLVAGAICLALMIYALGFVWYISVENAGPYAGEVRFYLEESGISPGVRRSLVDIGKVRDDLEWRLPKVKWVRVEWRGVTLRLILEEGTPPPDLADGTPGDIVAREDGIVRWIAAYAGTPQVKPGDFVRAGQTLIRGEERGENGEIRTVQAQGEVMARVWVTASVRLPLREYESIPTGNAQERRVIETPFSSWTSREEPEYLVADREIRLLPLGGAWAPITLRREVYREVYLEKTGRNMEDVKREGAKAALEKLNLLVIHDEIVDKWLNFSMIERDTIVVEATAEVSRQIGEPTHDESGIPGETRSKGDAKFLAVTA